MQYNTEHIHIGERTLFEHLITRAEIIEARVANYMGQKADAIEKRYEGKKGNYLSIAFGFMYYVISSVTLPFLTGSLIFLYLFLRYLLPLMYVLFCVSFLASTCSYLVTSNIEWVSQNFNALALLIFRPLLSNQAIFVIYIIVPVFLVSAFFISVATAIAIQYRKAIYVDTVI